MGAKLFVGGLSYDATEDELREIFSAHGNLKDVHIATDKETGRSKAFGFVTISSKKEGTSAIKELNDTEIQSRKITVQESKPSGGRGRRRPRRN